MDSNSVYDGMPPISTKQIDGMWNYLKTIDWTEPWLTALGVFHITCTLTIILVRERPTVQGILFTFLLISVYCAVYINEWAASNWKKFSNQQYFDSKGLFISVVFSCPVLFNCLIIVILWLKSLSLMLSDTRMARTAYKKRLSEKQNNAQNKECSSESKKDQ